MKSARSNKGAEDDALLAAAMARASAAEFTDCNGYVPNLPNEKRSFGRFGAEACVSVPDTPHWIYTPNVWMTRQWSENSTVSTTFPQRGCVSPRSMCRTLEETTFAPHLTFSFRQFGSRHKAISRNGAARYHQQAFFRRNVWWVARRDDVRNR